VRIDIPPDTQKGGHASYGVAAMIVVAVIVAVAAGFLFGRTRTERVPTGQGKGSSLLLAPGRKPIRYIWTGTPGRQFTTAEFRAIARDDHLVVIEKGHGNSFGDWDVAARKLGSLDPHLTVLVDFPAGVFAPALQQRWGSSFKRAWLLRDENGDLLKECSAGRCIYRVDVSNPAYRNFLEEQVMRRLRAAPYSGVMFDNLHSYDAQRYPTLTTTKIDQLNAGFRTLLREMRHQIGPKQLFFNGVARSTGDRGFDLLRTANGAQDEFFCYLDNRNTFRPGSELALDDATYQRFASHHETILESVHLESAAAQADARHIERYCFGHYLMSEVPGYTYVQFKWFGLETEGPAIADNFTTEQTLQLGAPVATFTRSGNVLRRQFENGWVFVNIGALAETITLPEALTLRNGARAGPAFQKGATYSIPGMDAAYFLNTPEATPTATVSP
jgi:hypothetical protein